MNNGGNVFPNVRQGTGYGGNSIECYGGLSLRDYFAAHALQVMTFPFPSVPKVWQPDRTDASVEEYAERAYRMADAMLKEREKECKST